MSKAGSSVQIEGTDKRATTNEQGAYELKGIEPGKYVLNISRAGMGMLRYELEVKADPIAFPTVMLDQQSTTEVKSMTPVGKSMHSLPDEVAAFECQIAYNPQLYPAPKMYSMRVFLGKTSDVSNTRYLEATQISQSGGTPAPVVRGTATLL